MDSREKDSRRKGTTPSYKVSRRNFLRLAGGLGFSGLAAGPLTGWLTPAFGQEVPSPLEKYPDRDWEKVYRDLFRYDDSFCFLCAPNDTHGCLLRAYVKNGVIHRISPTYGYGKSEDVYGNRASARWDPRCCQKGLGMVRRFYGDRRVRGPMVRKGFKDWVDKGFPRDPNTGKPPEEFFQRGKEPFVPVSWDEAFKIVAKGLENIARTYSGPEGASRLKAQGYDEAMVASMDGAGTRTLKFRGGMPLLGVTRIFAKYRLANSMALLDSYIRGVGPDRALGGRGWDNYTWHTDLPPGHPMVTGQQTIDWDLFTVENAKMIICWGMNWISTKMPDGHWLTEARLRGTKVVVVAAEYSSTANKADEVVIVRPGTSPALALGMAGIIMREKLYDEQHVRSKTDLPLLVRTDTWKLLRASDVIKDYKLAELNNFIKVKDAKEIPPPPKTEVMYVPPQMREEWGDFVMWDTVKNGPAIVTRDRVGKEFEKTGIMPALEGEFDVTTVDGKAIKVTPVFALIKKYIDESLDPDTVSEITWAPTPAIFSLAREIAANPKGVLLCTGMGPNQFFNGDLKDRAVLLLAALTANIGYAGGNVGSYAGNYRAALYNGLPQWIAENPFDIELNPAELARPKLYWKAESAHHFDYGDRILKAGNTVITGKTHMPTPTKACLWSNGNSILGNAKWHFDVVNNTLPKIEMIVNSDWWWSGTCEYSDVVFAVDSWAEHKFPDLYAAVTNPFCQVFPPTPLPRIVDSRHDMEVAAGISSALAEVTGDKRFVDYFKFVHEGKVEAYLQRIINLTQTTKGYDIEKLKASCAGGTPALMMTRTYPRVVGWEQAEEDRPWYTKTGRSEFYREEPEFMDSGENIPVHREPVDSTFHEPNVIVGAPQPCIKPKGPADYGIPDSTEDVENRQVRHVIKPWAVAGKSPHPLRSKGYRFILHTPKYRHAAHTTPADTDFVAVWLGPFGDPVRRDKRKPFVTEHYLDINPLDAKSLGIDDGDYIYVDADPQDRPFRGWKPGTEEYKAGRMMCRARYYPGTPRGVTRMWHNVYTATFGSVRGHEDRPDGLAKNPFTGYQAMFRYGSHQSVSRCWLKPTWETDSLVRKNLLGQGIGKGFESDVHCANGAPREAFVKITRAEPGGIGGKGLWEPAARGLRPTYESREMKKYLSGAYTS